MASDDSFAEQVLPGSASAERARYSVPPLYYGSQVNQHRQPSVELDASNEVLVKAQLRLEEHRHLNSRGGLAATPARLGYEVGGVHSTPRNSAAGGQNRSPLRITPTPRDRSARSAASGAPGYLSQARNDFSITAASQQQRLQLENERLQKEVSYLTVENQKLRAATISADSSENIKLQLTIDMLRGELEQKEGLHQNELGKLSQENGNLQQKLKSTLEQADSYASSAHQYKSLYEEKQRDLEQLKAQMQNMRYKLEEAEERVRLADSQSKDEVSAAGEKARQLMDILDDVKMQREHVHALNEQLQGELRQAKEDRAKFKAQADKAQQAVLRERELHEKELARVQLDVSTLKEDAKTRERSFEARLREEKKIQESLELRLNESKQEREEEARNYRKIIDDVRNDNKRALNDEAARRAKVEEKARRLETELRDAITRRDDALRAEQEKRIQHYRQEYQNEKRERESAQLVVQRLAEDNARLEEDVQGLHAEVEMLSSNLTLSEEDRARNAQQCELLSNTLSDLMAHDDEQAAAIEELKKALEEALTELQNNTRQSRKSASPQANDVANQQLTAENERLSNECSRLAQQRDSLIEENGNIAQELLKWKNEMKKYIASQ